MKPIVAILPCLMLLAACGSEPAPDQGAGEDGTAAGEVLEGSISDEMLPLDTIRSQSPSLEKSPAASATGNASDEAEGDGDEEGGAADTTTEPTSETPAETE